MEPLIVFATFFVISAIWYRILFAIVPKTFDRPFTRRTLKIQWHHLHTGIVLVFFSLVYIFIRESIDIYVAAILGIGMGLIVDLFLPSIFLKTNREEELTVYRDTLFHSLLLVSVITCVLIGANFF